MEIPKLQIGSITSDLPIVQGAMGVRVSLSSLSAAVANEGGIGTIASVGLGDINAGKNEYEAQSREALVKEIRKAKSMTDGHIAINVMDVLSNSKDLIQTSVREGIKQDRLTRSQLMQGRQQVEAGQAMAKTQMGKSDALSFLNTQMNLLNQYQALKSNFLSRASSRRRRPTRA